MRALCLAILAAFVGGSFAFSIAAHADLGGGLGGNGGFQFGMSKQSAATAPAPTFDLNIDNIGSGPSLLSDTLEAGSSVTLVLACDGRDESGTTWTCDTGPTMTETGAGTAPAQSEYHPFTESAASVVDFAAGKYYAAATSTVDVGTSDAVWEVVFRSDVGSSSVIAAEDDNGTSAGWRLFDNGAGSVTMQIGDGVDTQTATVSYAANLSAWSHVLCMRDDGSTSGLRCSINAAEGTATNPQAVDDTTTASVTTIGANVDGLELWTGSIASIRVWTGSFAIADLPTLADTRFAKLTGLYPTRAVSPLPTFTRATASWTDVSDGSTRRIAKVTSGWPRVIAREDSGSTLHEGFLSEPAATNQQDYSATFCHASFTHTAATCSSNAATAPDGTTTAEELTLTGAGSVTIAPTTTSSSGAMTFSLFVKRVDANAQVLIYDGTGTGYCVFQSDTCSYTSCTNGSGVNTGYAEDWGGGWCRFGTYNTNRTPAATAHSLLYFGGSVGQKIYVWGGQAEVTNAIPTSYIDTPGTADVTRNADVLTYPVANFSEAQGTMETKHLLPTYNVTTSSGSHAYGFTLDSGNVNVNGWYMNTPSVAGGTEACRAVANVASSITLDDSGNTFEAYDNAVMSMRAVYGTNYLSVYCDGAQDGTAADVSGAVPTSLTRMHLNGYNGVNNSVVPQMITRARLWSQQYTPAQAP